MGGQARRGVFRQPRSMKWKYGNKERAVRLSHKNMQQGKNVLGLKVVGHDPGAALISGNRVVAISEERLNRNKYSTGMFPVLSIPYCLDALGLTPSDIALIVMDCVGEWKEEEVLARFTRENPFDFSKAEVKAINHHLAHAASAFFCSPFSEAAVMVVDGVGS